MSSADVLNGTLATTTPTAGAATGEGDGAPAGEVATGGGFTALLAAALGTSDPTAVAKVLEGLQQAGDGEPAAPDVPLEGEGDQTDASPDALQQAVAALVAEVGPLRLPADARGEASVGASTPVEAEVGRSGMPAATPRSARAALLSALRAAATGGRIPTVEPDGQGAAGTAPTVDTATATASTSRPLAATEGVTGSPSPVEATSSRVPGRSTPRVVVPPATDAATTSGTAADGATPAPAPVHTAGAGTAPTAAPATAPPAPPAPADGGLHARVVSRVMEAAELLENAPPPRRMTVEVPDSDGLRLLVSMRGSEVHVSLHAGRGAPDLGAWGRELAASLASRGMSLAGFGSGDASQAGRDQQQGHQGQPRPAGQSDQSDQPDRHDDRRRPPHDGDLRL